MHLSIILLISFSIFCGFSESALVGGNVQASKPKYLDIEGWKECMDSKQMNGAHEVWCLPEEKGANCTQPAWDQLKGLEGNELPQNCSSIS